LQASALLTWKRKPEDGLCKYLEKRAASAVEQELGAPSAADTICESPVAPKACEIPIICHMFLQVASALEQELGAPALLIPFGQASDACHLANERLARANLLAGKNVFKHLLHEVASA